MFRRTFLIGLPALGATAALADGDLVSGPEPGKPLPELKVLDVTGPQKDKELNYVAERKEKPTVYLFLREFDRPIARFMKLLDTAIGEDGGERMSVAVWIHGEKEKNKEYLPRVQGSIKLEKTAMTTYLGDPTVPGWEIHGDARLTAIVAAKGKVTARFGYVSVNDTLVREVRQALTKAAEIK
jgi:hypothetical protein